MVDYTTRIDGDVVQLCYTDPDTSDYWELPVDPSMSDADRQTKIDEKVEDDRAEKIYYENIEPDFTRNFRDEVYMNGEVKRIDYSCDRPEALTEINRLVAAFTEYTVEQITAGAQNVIGQYGAYRPPYNDNSISFYDFTTPSVETLAAYGCDADTYGDDLLGWHGIKHDLTNLTKTAKFVFTQSHGTYLSNAPISLPTNRSIFFARIHNADGTVEPWVDVYIISTINYMRDWCAEHGLTFPLPDDVTQQPWCFSVVYNDDTGEMANVKAYIRHRYED
jgi:hypothetical protein